MKKKQNTFQKKLKKLEEIQENIQENKDHDIETLVSLYEEGLKLATELEKEIETYEHRILAIVSNQHETQKNTAPSDIHSSNNEKEHIENTATYSPPPKAKEPRKNIKKDDKKETLFD